MYSDGLGGLGSIPERGKGFFFLFHVVQIDSGAHTVSYTEGYYLGVKAAGARS
jgi:hypothetical protein